MKLVTGSCLKPRSFFNSKLLCDTATTATERMKTMKRFKAKNLCNSHGNQIKTPSLKSNLQKRFPQKVPTAVGAWSPLMTSSKEPSLGALKPHMLNLLHLKVSGTSS